ncbi:glycerate kinase [Amycolatopsis sp. NPDC051371]|uniref:glycerate kinase n=1 Tax=Amycolatopsis sp. NPDC051371 TaxID=3155800 RepID=UPI00344A19BB
MSPGSGAAGGVAAALFALGAESRPGIDLVLELTGCTRCLADAGLVVTGEGSLDRQTLNGKAPAGVAAAGIPVIAASRRVLLGGIVSVGNSAKSVSPRKAP